MAHSVRKNKLLLILPIFMLQNFSLKNERREQDRLCPRLRGLTAPEACCPCSSWSPEPPHYLHRLRCQEERQPSADAAWCEDRAGLSERTTPLSHCSKAEHTSLLALLWVIPLWTHRVLLEQVLRILALSHGAAPALQALQHTQVTTWDNTGTLFFANLKLVLGSLPNYPFSL